MGLELLLVLVLLGMATGFYSGLLGTGGNVILIPAFDMLFMKYAIESQEAVKFIIAHSLAITVFNGLFVSYRQLRIRNFHYKETLWIGVPAAIVGFCLSEVVKNAQWYNKLYFDILFAFLVLLVSIRFLFYRNIGSESHGKIKASKPKSAFAAVGILTGATTAMSGFGGGIIVIPALADLFKMAIKKASSISIGVITLLATAVSLSYLNIFSTTVIDAILPNQFGYISLSLVAPISLGILFGAPLGVKVAQKASANSLRIVFGVVMGALCFKMVFGLL